MTLVDLGLGVGPRLRLAVEVVARLGRERVHGGGHLAHLEGRQEAVLDAGLEGVFVDWLAEPGVGVHVRAALGCRGQAELCCGGEVLQDAPPGALVAGAAAVAFVDHHEVEESRAGSRDNWARRLPRSRPRHLSSTASRPARSVISVWKIEKKTAPFIGTPPFFLMRSGVIRTMAPSSKAVKAFTAWSARMLRSARNRMRGRRLGCARQVPARFVQAPGDLEGDGGLAGAGGQRQQDAALPGRRWRRSRASMARRW